MKVVKTNYVWLIAGCKNRVKIHATEMGYNLKQVFGTNIVQTILVKGANAEKLLE